MKSLRLALLPAAALLLAGCGGERPATSAPASAPSPAAADAVPELGAAFVPGQPLLAVVTRERKPVAQQMDSLKALAGWAAGKKIAGTPMLFVYDGPCDGGPAGWTSDAGWLLSAPPPAGFDPAPYEVREFVAPAPKVARATVAGATLQGIQPKVCSEIATIERQYHGLPPEARWFHFAMNAVILHGMKNFTLDEPVTIELREPHYEKTAEGRMPGPVMPTPFPEPPKPAAAPAPASAPASAPATKPAPKPAPAAKPAPRTAPRRAPKPAAKPAPAPKAAPAGAPAPEADASAPEAAPPR